MIARLAYAALFSIALPLLLAAWARALDAQLALPRLHAPALGWGLTSAALALMLGATRDLWVRGGGLPASPFPPVRLVTRGVYGLVRDPLYLGAVLATIGVSLAVGSPGGLWIVAPVLAASCTAFPLSGAFPTAWQRSASTCWVAPGVPSPWARFRMHWAAAPKA